MNETQLEIALGAFGHFEAELVDEIWEIKPLGRDIVGHGRTFVEAVLDLVDKWPNDRTVDPGPLTQDR